MIRHFSTLVATPRRPHRLDIACALIAQLALTSSCVQVQPEPEFEQVRQLIMESTGAQEVFDPYSDSMTDEEIETIVADGLSLEEAMRLTLVNSRQLQADFMNIGVAHAEWVQSGLLSNPSLDVLLRFPTDGGQSMLEAILVQPLLELWRIPVRKEVMREALTATVLQIARRAGVLLAASKTAYYRAAAAGDLHRISEENLDVVRQSYEAVQDLHEAGTADAFDENLALGQFLGAELALRSARLEAANAKRSLGHLLGIGRNIDPIALTDPLPEPSTTEAEVETVIELARRSRLDLRSVAAAIKAIEAQVELEHRRAWGTLAAGATVERGVGGETLVGPALSLTLPLFDQNQAQISKAQFRYEQLIRTYEAVDIALAQDVRAAVDRSNTAAASLRFYRQDLIPQAEQSMSFAQDSYSAGRSTLFVLLEVQRSLIEARRGYLTLWLEMATASVELERLVGVPLEKIRS